VSEPLQQDGDDGYGAPLTHRPSVIYNAAHEMRTPLVAILGFAEVLRRERDEIDDSEVDRMLGHIITNALAEVRIIDRWLGDLRDGNGNGNGNGHPENHPTFDVRAEVEVLCGDIAPLINAHPVDVRVAAGVVASGPPDVFREVLSNLLVNAVKYSDAESTITVTAEATRALVTVSVNSRGGVVGPHELRRLFKEGYRVSPHAGIGSGLGLSIARDLVTRLGGRIWAESAPSGTSFKFTIPLAPAFAVADEH
jgi:signal transduction histidine kinase